MFSFFKKATPEPEKTRREPRLATRSFRAAKPDRLASGFGTFATSQRQEMRQDIRGLVQHSRHASQNFDYARNYEMLFRRHVVGPQGIRLQMDVRDPNGKPDLVANATLEQAWAKWGKRGNPTICGRLSWWGVEKVIATSIAREGGAFVRFHRGRNRGPFGFQIEPISFDLLDLDLTQPLAGGGYIEAGIEFNGDGRIMAFHIWSVHPAEGHIPTPRRRLRIPADQMIYVMPNEEVGQALGIPRTATALRLMNMSETYQESAMAAAHYGAANMVFFKQVDDSGQISEKADAEIPIDEIDAGTMATLPPGYDPVFNQPTYPDAAVEPFMRHMGTSQAAGLGVSYETLSTDLSRANFSSLRAGKGEERDEWRMLQRDLYEGLHEQVFPIFLEMGILTGRIGLPFAKLEKFNAASWRPRGWESVNPKDDAIANKTNIELGLKSRTEIAGDRGRDLNDVTSELEAETKKMTAAGLTAPPDPKAGKIADPSKVGGKE